MFRLYTPGSDYAQAVVQFRAVCETQYDVVGIHEPVSPKVNAQVLVRFTSNASSDEAFKARLAQFVAIVTNEIDGIVCPITIWRNVENGTVPFVDTTSLTVR